jgi:parallel beta-helix repeat protein
MSPSRLWILVAVAAASLAASRAAAQLACGATVAPRTSATLSGDVGPCDGVAAAITVDSATLDLGGRTVTCSDGDGDGDIPPGIVLLGKKARVGNGRVVGCRFGVVAAGTGKHRVEGVTATSSVRDGILVQSNKNTLSGNNTSGNGDEGIEVDGDKNKLTGNTAANNAGDGINVVTGNKNKLTGNTVSGNGDEGFEIIGSRNKLKGNTATGNATQGIDIDSDGAKNQIIGNTATGNVGGPDIIDSNGSAGCRKNKWRGNTFGTRSPDCLK